MRSSWCIWAFNKIQCFKGHDFVSFPNDFDPNSKQDLLSFSGLIYFTCKPVFIKCTSQTCMLIGYIWTSLMVPNSDSPLGLTPEFGKPYSRRRVNVHVYIWFKSSSLAKNPTLCFLLLGIKWNQIKSGNVIKDPEKSMTLYSDFPKLVWLWSVPIMCIQLNTDILLNRVSAVKRGNNTKRHFFVIENQVSFNGASVIVCFSTAACSVFVFEGVPQWL